jgi:hypothetical protein
MRIIGALATMMLIIGLLDGGCAATAVYHNQTLGNALSMLGGFILGWVCMTAFDKG